METLTTEIEDVPRVDGPGGGLAVVVYGRNDGHGYNLPRRVASSLNAYAEVLRDQDEILFVDCNTDDLFPTFPQAIADTLTDRARARLRVIRIRPAAYRRLCPQARLHVHEPFCRNVAIRRVSPHVEWILSTNTDIVPDLRDGRDIGGLLEGLDRARLHIAPRLEIPELLWENLDRRDPARMLERIRHHVRCTGLGVVVHAAGSPVHDGPGDFQLVHRDLLHRLSGFDESITGGWHVDGNFCARAALASGGNASLAERVLAHHLDHNRMASGIHRNSHNSLGADVLVHGVVAWDVPLQARSWGAPAETFEEFRLDQATATSTQVLDSLSGSAEDLVDHPLGEDSFNFGISVESKRVFPHLASHLDPLPPGCRLAYLGASEEMVSLLRAWVHGRGGDLVLSPSVGAAPSEVEAFLASAVRADAVIVDAWSRDLHHTAPSGPGRVNLRKLSGPLGDRCRHLHGILERLHALAAGRAKPVHLFVSSQHTWLEPVLQRGYAFTVAPWASRVRPALPVLRKPWWKRLLSK